MQLLDRLYVTLAPRIRCFDDGWGDRALMDRPLDPSFRDEAVPPLEITWTRARAHASLRLRYGVYESPDRELPDEVRHGRLVHLRPRYGDAHALCVVLGAWNDVGFDTRRTLYGRAVSHGVSLLLLETPFYGPRARVGQRGTALRYASDFVSLGRGLVTEARAALEWAREQGYPRVGLAGFSMGAQLAAMTAAVTPFEVHLAAIAPSVTPASVFFDGPLGSDLSFEPLGEGGRERFEAVLRRFSVLSLPPPLAPSRVRLVGTRRDGIVPPGDVGAIGRHFGVSPRWIDDGHVSAAVFRRQAFSQAVIDAFAMP